MKRGLLLLLMMAASGLTTSLAAQSAMERATEKADGQTITEPAPSNALADEVTTALPSAPGDVVLTDGPTRQKYLAAMQRYYDYRADGYAYRSRVFEWQLLSSRAIFAIVLALVGAGMYFAAVQFRVAMQEASRRISKATTAGAAPVTADAAETKSTLATQIEVSAKGIIVNSSVLGVIILGLSLAFFYLYLVYVYPIHNVL